MQVSDAEIKRVLGARHAEIVGEIESLMEGIDDPNFEIDQAMVDEITAKVQAMPDREDRIAELKARIDSGTYEVTSEQIVDAMIRRAIADSIR